MAETDVDTSRTEVRTYVPAYQRDEWDDHAEELGMSRSEYVRSMIQAGRRGFGEADIGADGAASPTDERTRSPDANPGGDGLETRVVDALDSGEYLSWDELLAELTDDIENRLEDCLATLQSEGRVTHSGRNGGYAIDE